MAICRARSKCQADQLFRRVRVVIYLDGEVQRQRLASRARPLPQMNIKCETCRRERALLSQRRCS